MLYRQAALAPLKSRSEMPRWQLQSHTCEDELGQFASEAAWLSHTVGTVTIDFQFVQFWTPAAISYLCAIVCQWLAENRQVVCINFRECRAFGYLQRMDFFTAIGIDLPESFRRHPAGTNFVEVVRIPPEATNLADEVSKRLSTCIAGHESDDAKHLAEFCLGEIIANVKQHSGSTGFCCAQYIEKHDWVRIGVADAGFGILESFRRNHAPIYLQNPEMDYEAALLAAMRPWISSRKHLHFGLYGEPSNRGVGLSMVQHMIAQSTGDLIVASGDAMLRFNGTNPVNLTKLRYPIRGTFVSARFPPVQCATIHGVDCWRATGAEFAS